MLILPMQDPHEKIIKTASWIGPLGQAGFWAVVAFGAISVVLFKRARAISSVWLVWNVFWAWGASMIDAMASTGVWL